MANERQQVINIPYDGYSATPSDYDCSDGQLATAINVVMEDGSLKPVLPAGRLHKFGDVQKVFIHKNSGYTHYIIVATDGSFRWCNGDWALSAGAFLTLPGDEKLRDIAAVGNILVVTSGTKMYYCLWKSKTGNYVFLDNEVPDVKMLFALSGDCYSHTESSDEIEFTQKETTTDDQWTTIGSVRTYTEGRDHTDLVLFADTVTLQSGVEYAIIPCLYKHFFASGWGHLMGVPEGGTAREEIKKTDLRTSRLKFTPTKNYTNLAFHITGLTVSYESYTKYNIGFVTQLERGVTGSTASRYVLKYTGDNYNAVMGIINKFVNQRATAENRFIYPFYVRYALKMYDGSYAHISSPILMCPNTGYVPFIEYRQETKKIATYAFIADLQYKFVTNIAEDWSDLVTGIDIFVSQPVYPYDQGQAYDSTKELFFYKWKDSTTGVNEVDGLSYGNLNAKIDGVSITDDKYQRVDLYDVLRDYFSVDSPSIIQIAPDAEGAKETLKNTSGFYQVASIAFDDMIESDDTTSSDGTTKSNDFKNLEPKSVIRDYA